MPRLKLPHAPRPPAWSELPAAPGIAVLVSRREFLKALALLFAALSLPWTRAQRAWAGARGGFFTAQERATLTAYVDRIIPPDADPGAAALGVPQYIERLLTAFDAKVPKIFAGGPYSGRTPLPNYKSGKPGHRRPKNQFKHFLQLTRLQRLYWRAQIFGSAADPVVAALDAQNGGVALTGLRDVYRKSLAMIDAVAQQTYGKVFTDLRPEQQDDVFKRMEGYTPDPRRESFNDIAIVHTLEGCFCAPEYGGNLKTRGWQMLGLEGDSQPLGYSIFDRTAGVYRQLDDHPMTAVNPDEAGGPRPLTADSQRIQTNISTFANAASATET